MVWYDMVWYDGIVLFGLYEVAKFRSQLGSSSLKALDMPQSYSHAP